MKYSTLQSCKILGLRRETLRAWLDKELIVPSERSKGKGTKSLFSTEDLYRIFFFQALCDAGVRQDKAAEMARNESFNQGRYYCYARRRTGPALFGDPSHCKKEIPSQIPAGPRTAPYQWMIVVDLEAIKKHVDEQIRKQEEIKEHVDE
jgi:DNA-binding transcriptional MerR regulator